MELVTSLCAEVTSAYEDVTSSAELNQPAALQLIFDLKLLQNVLLPREKKVEFCFPSFWGGGGGGLSG